MTELKEYILDKSSLTDNAEGKKYIRFVTDTLKPYVDSVYRTKQEREFTGIGGSSLALLNQYLVVVFCILESVF